MNATETGDLGGYRARTGVQGTWTPVLFRKHPKVSR